MPDQPPNRRGTADTDYRLCPLSGFPAPQAHPAGRSLPPLSACLLARRRWWSGPLLSLASILLFLALAEALLAFLGLYPPAERADPFDGFSHNYPMFVPCREPQGDGVMVTRPALVREGRANGERFPLAKPHGTFRIFLFGGSVAYGDPWGKEASFGRFLQDYLSQVMPGRRIELINAGVKAQGSTRELILLDELLGYQPDLLLIYTGNNELLEEEFYRDYLEHPPALLFLRIWADRLRLYHLLKDAGRRLGAVKHPAPRSFGAWEVQWLATRPAFHERLFLFDGGQGLRPELTEEEKSHIYGRFSVNLAKMARRVKEAGVETLWIAPLRNPALGSNEVTRRILHRFAAAEGVPLADCQPEMAWTLHHVRAPFEVFLDEVHYTPEGNRLMAYLLAQKMAALGVPSAMTGADADRLRETLAKPHDERVQELERTRSAQVLRYLGHQALLMREWERAVDLLEEGLSASGCTAEKTAIIRVDLGLACTRLGRIDEARHQWEEIRDYYESWR